MTDKLATYDNVRGVFADLDDGGLTNDEALMQIRRLVGAKPPLTQLVLSGTLPFTITVDIADGAVTEFEVDYTQPTLHQLAEIRKTGEEIDADLYADEIAKAKEIAKVTSWPEPEGL